MEKREKVYGMGMGRNWIGKRGYGGSVEKAWREMRGHGVAWRGGGEAMHVLARVRGSVIAATWLMSHCAVLSPSHVLAHALINLTTYLYICPRTSCHTET